MYPDDHMTMVVPITPSSSSGWSRAQDKIFERALVVFPDDTPHRWEKIAAEVPGKSPSDVREHYEILLHDVSEIDSGRVELTSYADNSFEPNWGEASTRPSIAQISFASVSGSKMTRAAGETERKKGVPWTAEEHRLFLIGLQRYGKGDWRSISRNAVVTRTPTQVASHAQKYYLRLNSAKKEKKRSSIHDITTVPTSPASRPNDQINEQMLVDGPYSGQFSEHEQFGLSHVNFRNG